jgi:hypothetical protein
MILHRPPGPGGGQFYQAVKPVAMMDGYEIAKLFNDISSETISTVTATLVINHLKRRRKKKRIQAKELSYKVHLAQVTRRAIREKNKET